jgi:UDP-2,3-diacylglucosamine pyrophosphatase LpxH
VVVFLSDLHLSDAATPAVPVARLLEVLSEVVRRDAAAGHRIDIVLLGDIFELLKSDAWLTTTLRPWDRHDTPGLERCVTDVFEGVRRANAAFFDGLSGLVARTPKATLTYVPGNHDGVVTGRAGRGIRELLRARLPLEGKADDPFVDRFERQDAGVLARHGHEWDPANRYDGGRVAVGDLVVIELLVHFPDRVRQNMSPPGPENMLAFLDEIDNVRPADPVTIAEWILRGAAECRAHVAGAEARVDAALASTARSFAALLRTQPVSSAIVGRRWQQVLGSIARPFLRRTRLNLLRRLPSGRTRADPLAYVRALKLDAVRNPAGQGYVVSGHTHRSDLQVLVGSDARPLIYLNTGTWKRVHAMTRAASGHCSFRRWEEECLVVIRTPAEQRDLPAWEFHRVSRGR